jgi:hypothetical protein
MSREEIEAFVRSAYEAVNREKRAVPEWWHPDGEFINSREDPDHAVYRGFEAIARQHAGWFDSYPDLHVEPLEIIPNGNRAFVWTRFTGQGAESGIPLEMELAHIWTVEDGKIRRIEEYFDRAEGLEVAGLSE